MRIIPWYLILLVPAAFSVGFNKDTRQHVRRPRRA